MDGRPTHLDEYAEHVLAGFERFYRFLVEHRPALLAPSSPLHDMAAQRVGYCSATHAYTAPWHRSSATPRACARRSAAGT
ncbi:MAG: DUF4135 domain-containing protein [Gemmatimonadota bacterium]